MHHQDPLFSRQKSNVGTLSRTSVTEVPRPDLVPAHILKCCAEQLAKPLQILLLRMLETASWPEPWREHWIVPIYKNIAVFSAGNHRGVHLTAQFVEGCRTLAAPSARHTHQSDSCFWTKSVRLHERSRCEGRAGLPHDVLDSCGHPTQESCCLLFGCFRIF